MNRLPRFRSALAIGAAAAVLAVAGVVFVNSGLVSRPTSPVGELSPVPTGVQTAVGCLSPAIVLTGAINGCVGFLEGMGCPRGSFDAPRVVHMRGSAGEYILYLEVDGGYHGPGTYQLTPWKKDTLMGDDNVAKVALRQWDNGVLWESVSGSLTIDSSEESGSVDAMLRLTDNASGSGAFLLIQGPWQCP